MACNQVLRQISLSGCRLTAPHAKSFDVRVTVHFIPGIPACHRCLGHNFPGGRGRDAAQLEKGDPSLTFRILQIWQSSIVLGLAHGGSPGRSLQRCTKANCGFRTFSKGTTFSSRSVFCIAAARDRVLELPRARPFLLGLCLSRQWSKSRLQLYPNSTGALRRTTAEKRRPLVPARACKRLVRASLYASRGWAARRVGWCS